MSKPILRIKEVAKERGMTLKAMAARIGIGLSALSQSIDGNPTVERLQQIADALGVPVTDLFEQTDISGYVEVGGAVKKISSIADLEEILNRARRGYSFTSNSSPVRAK